MGYYILFPNHAWVCQETPEAVLAYLRATVGDHKEVIIVDATNPGNVMDFNELLNWASACPQTFTK